MGQQFGGYGTGFETFGAAPVQAYGFEQGFNSYAAPQQFGYPQQQFGGFGAPVQQFGGFGAPSSSLAATPSTPSSLATPDRLLMPTRPSSSKLSFCRAVVSAPSDNAQCKAKVLTEK